jgi:microcin C transport system substrate-binding protein
MPRTILRFAAFCLAALLATASARAEDVRPVHGLAMHGPPKYPAGFRHFDYVNPDAPKGGTLRLAAVSSSFDNLNPYIVKGLAVAYALLPFESLLVNTADEPFSEYGLIAESLEVPADRSWVVFNLRPQGRWHDGKPITADDVLFSFDVLRTKGHPQYRFYYQSVAKAEKLGERRVRFVFKPGDNRELPLVMGQMPVLPKHYWQGRDFDKTTLEPPLGSGPYRVLKAEPGRFVEYERVKDYWGQDLPVRRGFNNFDRIHIDYYRDSTVALEAFKAGEYDYRFENEAKKWATGYQDWAALADGRGRKEAVPNSRPDGMQAFVFNLRRPQFQDARVRRALAYAFDFEWTNKNLFYGQYTRTESYFSNSELAATGLPGPAEIEVLTPLKDRLPPEVFTTTYKAPATDGSGDVRPNLRIAMKLLEEAGWKVVDGKLTKDGRPLRFEILLENPMWERVSLPFVNNLARLGVDASVRTVDTSQFKNRADHYDFDMVVNVWGESLSPGNEQRGFWTSEAADEVGGDNLAGIKNPAIDVLVDKVIAAKTREQLVARTRALDRALLWNHYVIPHWHLSVDRVAWWDKFGMPPPPPQGVQLFTWWSKER